MKIEIDNRIESGSCILWYRMKVGSRFYVCYGDSFDGAIAYFKKYFYEPWMEVGVISYYYITPVALHQLSLCC